MGEPLQIGRWERRLLPAELGAADGRRTPRDWLVDLAAAAFAVAIGALAYASARENTPPPPIWLDVGLGCLALAALGWRRRFPVPLALAGSAATAVSASAAGPTLVLLFSVAVHRTPRVTLAVALASCLPIFVFYALFESKDSLAVELSVGLALTAAVVAWGMFARVRRQLVISLAERARTAELRGQERLERARVDERTRIAREMHDVLAHRLSLLALHAGALEFRRDADPDAVARAAGVVRASAHDALGELREVIGLLRGERTPEGAAAPEPPQPTLDALRELLEESRAAGVRVDAAVDLGPAAVVDVPATLGRTAYRIVQEGLTNARRHAAGARVQVRIQGRPEDGLVVEVRNPLPVGIAARPASTGAGVGLIGLGERAVLSGGRLEHGPTGDAAFVLRAWLPWPA